MISYHIRNKIFVTKQFVKNFNDVGQASFTRGVNQAEFSAQMNCLSPTKMFKICSNPNKVGWANSKDQKCPKVTKSQKNIQQRKKENFLKSLRFSGLERRQSGQDPIEITSLYTCPIAEKLIFSIK